MDEKIPPSEKLAELRRRFEAKTPEQKREGLLRLMEMFANMWREAEDMKAQVAAQYLLDTGLLFEINRKVLHPFGLALSVTTDDTTGDATGEFGLVKTDDLEGMEFTVGQFMESQAKLDNFLQHEGGAERLAKRITGLGFVTQELRHAVRRAEGEEPGMPPCEGCGD